MKDNDRVTMTLGQLKRLVKESLPKADIGGYIDDVRAKRANPLRGQTFRRDNPELVEEVKECAKEIAEKVNEFIITGKATDNTVFEETLAKDIEDTMREDRSDGMIDSYGHFVCEINRSTLSKGMISGIWDKIEEYAKELFSYSDVYDKLFNPRLSVRYSAGFGTGYIKITSDSMRDFEYDCFKGDPEKFIWYALSAAGYAVKDIDQTSDKYIVRFEFK